LYGRRGFTQYQCVLPDSAGLAVDSSRLLTKQGAASFSLRDRDCGEQGEDCCRFPKGTSVALDPPVRDNTPGVKSTP
jgi:hypothetical protein